MPRDISGVVTSRRLLWSEAATRLEGAGNRYIRFWRASPFGNWKLGQYEYFLIFFKFSVGRLHFTIYDCVYNIHLVSYIPWKSSLFNIIFTNLQHRF